MNILVKPVISEKAASDSELNNRYTFVVAKGANKIEIKKAVEDSYGVTVLKVRTMNVRPDRKVRFTKSGMVSGKTSAYKKAVVQVAENDIIEVFGN